MMKIKGVALASYAEQKAGGDLEPVHPDVIKLHNQHVRVTIGFETAKLVGETTRMWREDGRILFEANIDDEALNRFGVYDLRDRHLLANTAAIGYTLEVKDSQGRLIKGGTIYEIGLTGENANRNAPAWEVIDES